MRVHLLQILLSLLLFQREFGIRNHPLQGHNLLREFGIKIYLSKIKDDLVFLLSGTQCQAVIPLFSGMTAWLRLAKADMCDVLVTPN